MEGIDQVVTAFMYPPNRAPITARELDNFKANVRLFGQHLSSEDKLWVSDLIAKVSERMGVGKS